MHNFAVIVSLLRIFVYIENTTKHISKMAEHKEHQKEAKAEKEAVANVVKVKFPRGVDSEGKQVFEIREISREIAEAELAKPAKVEDIKEGEPVKLRNSAFIGAEIVK